SLAQTAQNIHTRVIQVAPEEAPRRGLSPVRMKLHWSRSWKKRKAGAVGGDPAGAGAKAAAIKQRRTGGRLLHKTQKTVLVFHYQQLREARRCPGSQQQRALANGLSPFAIQLPQQIHALIQHLGITEEAARGQFPQAQL